MEIKTTEVRHTRISRDGRGTVYVFDCPYCKRGKNAEFSTVLVHSLASHSCNACGEDYYIDIQAYEKENQDNNQ